MENKVGMGNAQRSSNRRWNSDWPAAASASGSSAPFVLYNPSFGYGTADTGGCIQSDPKLAAQPAFDPR